MTNTQHTPGPWMRRTPRGENAVMAEDGCFIAVVYTGPEDARLIAASPEMLDALEEFCRECDGYLDGNDGSPWGTLLKGRAAIAKATGQ